MTILHVFGQDEVLRVRKEMARVKKDAPWLFKGGRKGRDAADGGETTERTDGETW